VGALSSPGTRPGIRPVMRQPSREGLGRAAAGFLSPFDVPALASWVIVCPLRNWAFLTVGLPAHWSRTSTGLSRCTWSSRDRAGRLLYPGDGGAHPAGDYSPAGTRRFPAASPYGPAGTTHRRGALSRDINGGSRHSPITPTASPPPGPGSYAPRRSSPCLWPLDGTGPLGLLPRASHPAVTRDARRGGDRPSRTGLGTTPMTSVKPSRRLPLESMYPRAAHNPRSLPSRPASHPPRPPCPASEHEIAHQRQH